MDHNVPSEELESPGYLTLFYHVKSNTTDFKAISDKTSPKCLKEFWYPMSEALLHFFTENKKK